MINYNLSILQLARSSSHFFDRPLSSIFPNHPTKLSPKTMPVEKGSTTVKISLPSVSAFITTSYP